MNVRLMRSAFCIVLLMSLAGFCKADHDKVKNGQVINSKIKETPHLHEHVHEEKKKSPFKVKFSGVVRLDAFFDSRQNVDSGRGISYRYPKDKRLDPNGDDINAKAQFTMVPFTGLKAHITGPELWGAKSLAVFKTDNEGKSGIYGLYRMKQGYFQLKWEKTELLVGRFYHPVWLYYPPHLLLTAKTVGRDVGRPIDARLYTSQCRVYHRIGDFEFIGALAKIYESIESRNAIAPELFGQVNFNIKKHTILAGANFHMRVPRLETDKGFKDGESLKSFIAFVASRVHVNNVIWLCRFIYSENADLHTLLNGFAVKQRDVSTDKRKYMSLRTLNFWSDISYHDEKREFGLFVGYSKNIGARSKIQRDDEGNLLIFSKFDTNIDYLLRIMPRVRFFHGPVTISFEYVYTRAGYGITNECGRVDNVCPVANNRFLVSVMYKFG